MADTQQPVTEKECGCGCGCGGGFRGCRGGCCWGKAAMALLLLLIGGFAGYFIGRGCGYHHRMMMACPLGVTAPAMPGK